MSLVATNPVAGRLVSETGSLAPSRRYWRWAAIVGIALGIFLCRGWLLWAVALPLIVADEAQAGEYLCVLEGDRTFVRAGELYRSGAFPQVLVVRRRAERLERMEILLPSEMLARRELEAFGVSGERIETLAGEMRIDWDVARGLQTWLAAHPAARVRVLTDRFEAGRQRYIFACVLGADADRVGFLGLPHRWYDETNWWHGKRGWLALFGSYVRLAYARLHGEDTDEWREWDLEGYARALP